MFESVPVALSDTLCVAVFELNLRKFACVPAVPTPNCAMTTPPESVRLNTGLDAPATEFRNETDPAPPDTVTDCVDPVPSKADPLTFSAESVAVLVIEPVIAAGASVPPVIVPKKVLGPIWP